VNARRDWLTPLTPEQWRAASPREIGLFCGATKEQARYLWPLSGFKPSPAFAPHLLSRHLRMIWRAGNRIGKTDHGAARIIHAALTCDDTHYRAVGPSFPHTVDVIGKKFHRMIPPLTLTRDNQFDGARGWKGKLIRFTNGSTIQIRSDDQDPINHSGDALHGIWCDEPPSPMILDENLGRLMDYDGWMLITLAPINAPCSHVRALAATPEWKEVVVPYCEQSAPWYSAEKIARRIAECMATPATFGQRINGDWDGATVDRHFSGFDPTRHVLADDRPFDAYRIGVDHGKGENRQVAYLVGIRWQTDGRHLAESLHVLREYKSGQAGQTAKLIAEGIYRMVTGFALSANLTPEHVVGLLKSYGDSNSSGLDEVGTFNEKINLELRALAPGLKLKSPVKVAGARENGEALLNERALADRLSVDPKCPLLVQALSHYIQGKPAYKDPIDGLRYGVYDTLARV